MDGRMRVHRQAVCAAQQYDGTKISVLASDDVVIVVRCCIIIYTIDGGVKADTAAGFSPN